MKKRQDENPYVQKDPKADCKSIDPQAMAPVVVCSIFQFFFSYLTFQECIAWLLTRHNLAIQRV